MLRSDKSFAHILGILLCVFAILLLLGVFFGTKHDSDYWQKVNYYVNYYQDKEPKRQAEIDE